MQQQGARERMHLIKHACLSPGPVRSHGKRDAVNTFCNIIICDCLAQRLASVSCSVQLHAVTAKAPSCRLPSCPSHATCQRNTLPYHCLLLAQANYTRSTPGSYASLLAFSFLS